MAHTTHRWSWPLVILMAMTSLATTAQAQVPPSATEAAHYTGLHAAAHKGDMAQLEKLLTGGAPLNARDTFIRTAVHIATFARQREVLVSSATVGTPESVLPLKT